MTDLSKTHTLEILIGLAVGDALGVPYEFLRREILDRDPAVTMRGHGTHDQPTGTWSDDTSLALCLAEMLAQDYDLVNLGNSFINWYDHAYWTAHNKVFDIGIATSAAIQNLRKYPYPQQAGGTDEYSNGNGSLMRILPLAVYLKDKSIADRYNITKDISSLTHGHVRSVLGCFIYLEFALQIMSGRDKVHALQYLRDTIPSFCKSNDLCPSYELNKFHRILAIKVGDYVLAPIESESRENISGSGYVLSTLEASIWCIMTSDSYTEAVLKAVNLGEDTDTTGCVTGGLAALVYGYDSIPTEWVDALARKDDIIDLANRLTAKYN